MISYDMFLQKQEPHHKENVTGTGPLQLSPAIPEIPWDYKQPAQASELRPLKEDVSGRLTSLVGTVRA